MATLTRMVHLSLLVCLGIATQCDDICNYSRDPSIQDAYCHRRNLTRIPSGCEEATTLHLGDNNITINADTFQNFTQLKILYFRQNRIKILVPGVFQPIAPTIQSLDLRSNVIKQLDNNTFVDMTKLEQLNLQKNQIIIIAKEAFRNLPRLELLFLLDNFIEHLPTSVFDEMPRLQQLHLQNNNLLNFNSRTLLNLNSLAHLLLSNNNITTLIGQPLHDNMQLQNINLSLNRLEQFDCQWTNALSTLISVDLSQNSIQSISNCQQTDLSILIDCDCTSLSVASLFHANINLTSPICHSPPGKRGQKLRDISLDECSTSNSPTVSTRQRLLTTQAAHGNPLSGRINYATTVEMVIISSSGIMVKEGYVSTNDNFFNDENILYYIIVGFCVLTIIVVILIVTILVRHFLHARKPRNSNHYTTTIATTSFSCASNRQSGASTGTRGSHLYATIPSDGRNTGNFDPSSIQIERGRESTTSSHREWDTRRQSDMIYRSPGHRSRNTRQEFNISVHLSDSQDSGLADQGHNRDSVTEWLIMHGGLHYLQIPDEMRDKTSSSEQPDDEDPQTVHPIPPHRIPHGDDHWIQPEMVTLLNPPGRQWASCRAGQPNSRENAPVSQVKSLRLQTSKERPSSGIYLPHHAVH